MPGFAIAARAYDHTAPFQACQKKQGAFRMMARAANGAALYSARDSVGTCIDSEGLVRELPDYCLRPQNTRIVYNVCPHLRDWGSDGGTGTLTQEKDDEYLLESLGTGDFDSINASMMSGESTEGRSFISSISIRSVNGVDVGKHINIKLKRLLGGSSAVATTIIVPLTLAYTRVALDVLAGEVDNTGWKIYITKSWTAVAADQCIVMSPQVEEVTGRTVTDAPSEYTSVGVEPAPYHGLFTDGIVALLSFYHNNSVASNVVTEGTPSGDIEDNVYYLAEPSSTNYCAYPDAFDNAAWIKNNITISADAIASPSGKSDADTLSASAGNGTCTDNIVLASNDVCFSIWLKRKTGTGNIDLTIDGGSSWTTIAITSSWVRYDIQQAAVTNPNVGIRIVTSGDEVYAWRAQLEIGDAPTSEISASGATVTRSADLGRFYLAGNFSQDAGTLVFDWITSISQANQAATDVGLITSSDSTTGLSYFDSGGVRTTDGTTIATYDPTYIADNEYRLAVRWNSSKMQIGIRDVDGAGSWGWSTDTNYDGAFALGSYLNLFFGVTGPEQMQNFNLWHADKGTAWVEANY